MSLSPDFLHELKKRFVGDLRVDPASKALYSTDASIYQIEPLGVAIPKTQDDLQSAVELAAKYNVPILPRGSGSSLGGQVLGEALIIDCSRYLDSIIELNSETHSATVEPGVILSDLNRAAGKHGLMFGPDPASAERATLGGVIGNNATGAHSILYGMSADHIIEANVILSDGGLAKFDDSTFESRSSNTDSRLSKIVLASREIHRKYAATIKEHFPKTWRNSAGYRLNYLLAWSPSIPPQWDAQNYGLSSSVYHPGPTVNVASLLAGSEGTLAIMRQVKVNLVPKPKNTILGVLAYKTISQACDDVPRLLEFKPSAIELIPQLIIEMARAAPAFARQMGWIVGDPAAVLVVEFSGDQPSALKEAARSLGELLTIAESSEEQARIWNIRKLGLGILDSRPGTFRPVTFIEDCAIPVENLGAFVDEIERILKAHGTYGGIYAHASAGCLHIRPVLDLQRGEGIRAMRSIVEQVFLLTTRLGGSMSSEHGDGIASGEFIERTYGKEVTDAMRMLKHAADPHNLLNPRKLFDAPAMDTHLRFGEDYRTQAWNSAIHFEYEHGLAGAIEHCNGQGVCRKTSGVMCPSFQATREESNSTRGRANLLRNLITSSEKYSELESATYSALDLCLACKGCTAECPSGVDMPRLKYEFMNQYYKTHRRPVHDYLFGYFHLVAAVFSPIAPLANAFMKMNWSHKLVARVTGITTKRDFPFFATKKAKQAPVSRLGHTGTVIFLSDVFARFLEPEVEQAAFDILNSLGFEVKVLRTVGAGASFLSKGFVDAARAHAEKVLAEIQALGGGAGLSVIGCEPPEVYCLKHEYLGLLPHRKTEIELITKDVWLIDEFLTRIRDSDNEGFNRLRNQISTYPKITFHPHCHQRAEGATNDGSPTGTSATVEMMRTFGFDVEVIDAGCCGMAGTFGYDEEHYELSMKIGELGVFPRARIAEALVSTGAACRMHIKHGTGKRAIHPLVLVAEHLNNKMNEGG